MSDEEKPEPGPMLCCVAIAAMALAGAAITALIIYICH